MNGRGNWDPELQAEFPDNGRKRKKRGPFQELRPTAACPSLVQPGELQVTKCPGHEAT